ncbi:MAG: hypothetical protein GY929_19170 [Actinomycetia bacterium]|nr:hypothetical protein [Actinomycetes bacterium]
MSSRDSRRYSGSRRSSNLFGALSFLAICVQIVAFATGGSVVVDQLSGPLTVPVVGQVGREGGGADAARPPLVLIVEDLAGDGVIGQVDPEVARVVADTDGRWRAELAAGRMYLAVVDAETLPADAVVRAPTPFTVADTPVASPVAGPVWFLGREGPRLELSLPSPPPDMTAGESVDLVTIVRNGGRVLLTDVEIEIGDGANCRVIDLAPGTDGSCLSRLATPMGTGILDVVAWATSVEGPAEAKGVIALTGSGFLSVDLDVAVQGETDAPLTLAAGSALDRTVAVHNTGGLVLGPIEVSDDDAGVICILDRLDVGQGRSCRVVRDAQSGSHTVGVSVVAGVLGGDGRPIVDPLGAPVEPLSVATSFAYEGTGAGVAPVERPATEGPDLSLAYGLGDARAAEEATRELLVGSEADRSYLIHNTGDSPLANLLVSDDEVGLVCTIPDLPVGAAQACTLPVEISEVGSHTSTATVSATAVDATGAPLLDDLAGLPQARVVARDVLVVRGIQPGIHAEVTMAPQAVVGNRVISTQPAEVVITNGGETSVVDLVAKIGVDDGAPASIVCDRDSAGPGQEVICRGQLELPPGASELRVETRGQVESTTGERLGRVTAGTVREVRIPVAALTSRPELVGASSDGRLILAVEVVNDGPDPASDLVLDLGLPEGAMAGGSGPGWRCADGGCVLGRLGAGEASTVRVIVDVVNPILEVTPRLDSGAVDAQSQASVLTVDVARAQARAAEHDTWAPWLGSKGLTSAAYLAMVTGLLLWWRLALVRRLLRTPVTDTPFWALPPTG